MPPTTPKPTKKSRSGSRAPVHPQTRAEKLERVSELTERMNVRLRDIDTLSHQRGEIIYDLVENEGVSLAEVSAATKRHGRDGCSDQAIHRAKKIHQDRLAKAAEEAAASNGQAPPPA